MNFADIKFSETDLEQPKPKILEASSAFNGRALVPWLTLFLLNNILSRCAIPPKVGLVIYLIPTIAILYSGIGMALVKNEIYVFKNHLSSGIILFAVCYYESKIIEYLSSLAPSHAIISAREQLIGSMLTLLTAEIALFTYIWYQERRIRRQFDVQRNGLIESLLFKTDPAMEGDRAWQRYRATINE